MKRMGKIPGCSVCPTEVGRYLFSMPQDTGERQIGNPMARHTVNLSAVNISWNDHLFPKLRGDRTILFLQPVYCSLAGKA